MVSLHDLCLDGNYIEFVLQDGHNIIDIHDNVFFKLLNNIKSKGYPFFQKNYKEFVHRNMFYENNEKNQIKVYKKSLHKMENLGNISMLVFHKEKLPYHVFPSTTMLHSISYVSKVVFKINNRVYINFEKKRYDNEEKQTTSFNKIYINYNHDENVDLTNIKTALDTSINLIKI